MTTKEMIERLRELNERVLLLEKYSSIPTCEKIGLQDHQLEEMKELPEENLKKLMEKTK